MRGLLDAAESAARIFGVGISRHGKSCGCPYCREPAPAQPVNYGRHWESVRVERSPSEDAAWAAWTLAWMDIGERYYADCCDAANLLQDERARHAATQRLLTAERTAHEHTESWLVAERDARQAADDELARVSAELRSARGMLLDAKLRAAALAVTGRSYDEVAAELTVDTLTDDAIRAWWSAGGQLADTRDLVTAFGFAAHRGCEPPAADEIRAARERIASEISRHRRPVGKDTAEHRAIRRDR